MEKHTISLIKEAIQYLVPATAIVLVQIYHRKTWIGISQTLALFFGSILSGVLFTEVIKILLEINFPEFMKIYGDRLGYFIVGVSVIIGFYALLFLFAKEEIFYIFNKLNKKGK